MSSGETTQPDDVPDRFTVDFTGKTLLGIYEVEAKLAEGGMGSVYRGKDTNLGRPVVIKVPHVKFVSESGFRKRFHNEIEELVRLEHPHIVRILAQGEHEDVPFFVLQFLGGGSLEDILDRTDGGVPIDDALRWLPPIATTLDFVHAQGTVHRDVKPGNILFDNEGHVFLSDFGVAKALEAEEDENLTDIGTGVGSPRYMAPEQITGGELTPSADQYALASALYEALVGRPPFHENSTIEMLMKKRSEDPEPLAQIIVDFPEDSSDAVQKALAREPSDRFNSCGDFAAAFQSAFGPAPETVEVKVPTKGPIATIAVLVVLLIVGGVFAIFEHGRDKPGPVPEDTGATNETGEARLTLIDPGQEPHRALRYHPAVGPLGTYNLHAKQHIVVKAEGQDEPTDYGDINQIWTVDFAVDGVTEQGDIQIVWETQKLGLDMKGDAANKLPESFTAQYESFAGTVDISPNGIARSSTITAAEDVHAIVKRDLPRMEWTIRNLAPSFPKEPVGVGARWEVAESTSMIGLRVTHTTTYEILKIEGDLIYLEMHVAQTAARQPMSMFGDMDSQLLSLHARGSGEGIADLTGLYSDSGTYDLEITMEMEMDMTGMKPEGVEDFPDRVKSTVDVKVHHAITRK